MHVLLELCWLPKTTTNNRIEADPDKTRLAPAHRQIAAKLTVETCSPCWAHLHWDCDADRQWAHVISLCHQQNTESAAALCRWLSGEYGETTSLWSVAYPHPRSLPSHWQYWITEPPIQRKSPVMDRPCTIFTGSFFNKVYKQKHSIKLILHWRNKWSLETFHWSFSPVTKRSVYLASEFMAVPSSQLADKAG